MLPKVVERESCAADRASVGRDAAVAAESNVQSREVQP